MASVVVVLDVMQVHRVGDTGHLVELAGVAPQVGVVDETLPVALEVAVVDRIEAHQRGEQAPVGFGHPVAQQVALAREALLQVVERREERVVGFLVGLLRGGEAGFVDAVVDAPVDRLVDGARSEEHTSELQSLMRISYAVFCLKKKIKKKIRNYDN